MTEPSNAEDPLEAQQMLLESSLPLAFEAYDTAVRAKMRQPVVILLDCEDAIGGEIARSWLGDDAVDHAIAERQADDDESLTETTVFAQAFPLAKCRGDISAVFPYLSPAFESDPPAEGFLAVAVTCGGASVLTVPFDARP